MYKIIVIDNNTSSEYSTYSNIIPNVGEKVIMGKMLRPLVVLDKIIDYKKSTVTLYV